MIDQDSRSDADGTDVDRDRAPGAVRFSGGVTIELTYDEK